MITHYLFVALGGALGSVARLVLSNSLPAFFWGIPSSILWVNVLGCFIMGLLTEFMALYWSAQDSVRYFLVSGFLSGFTTFSAFSLEFGLLFQKNEFLQAFVYVTLSISLSLLFFFLGVKIIRLF